MQIVNDTEIILRQRSAYQEQESLEIAEIHDQAHFIENGASFDNQSQKENSVLGLQTSAEEQVKNINYFCNLILSA